MEGLTPRQEREKYVPDARLYKRPMCWLQGHDRRTNDKGWHEIYCRVCGRNLDPIKPIIWLHRLPFILSRGFLLLANKTYGSGLTHYPHYRGIDTKALMDLGTEHSCDAYSYEHLKSLTEQDGPDGFGATATIAWLISEDGWRNVGLEDIDMINESFEYESNRQERAKSMRIMRGEEPNEDIEQ